MRERCARPREMTRRTSSPGRSATLSLSGFQFRLGRGGSSVFCRGARCIRTSSCSRRRWPRGVWPRFQSATVHLHLHLLELHAAPSTGTHTNAKNVLGRPSGGGADAGLGRSLRFFKPPLPAAQTTNHGATAAPNSPIRLSKERGPPACLGESRQSRTRDSTRDKQSGRTQSGGGAHTLSTIPARDPFSHAQSRGPAISQDRKNAALPDSLETLDSQTQSQSGQSSGGAPPTHNGAPGRGPGPGPGRRVGMYVYDPYV